LIQQSGLVRPRGQFYSEVAISLGVNPSPYGKIALSATFRSPGMTPRRCGPLAYVPIHHRLPLTWPDCAWVNPNIEFFGVDDVMPSNLNDRVPREQAKIPDVRNCNQLCPE
jgi:hypothetical protein